ncbi:T6SS phospholipase effector Tle1-like catalytic domain-containing protein [Pseudomonas sp. PSKL.D1]|uniref:T6SS phospholipase effector Tle1-like catalytic domain-containing protein n=1 Tax=Pseudomonas sp. PSKL.D1 TaxID=3029060 RepID=UPI00238180B4|nr:DUF2235 domain-containing protein [Pseudomonas sp. PSKL.D1]WDY56474.1 DUF2235 domain-containing protein [Pseudomonas sp. PSKL.D1]
MATQDQAVTLQVGLFFDGTGNNRGNAVRGEMPHSPEAKGSYASAVSNIALLFEAYEVAEPCLALYVEGPGTVEGQDDSDWGWYTGVGETGVRARVEDAASRLAGQVSSWLATRPQLQLQALQFDLFGFSRGAAGARDFANDLRKHVDSLLAKAATRQPVTFAPALGWKDGIDIRFIGLFDTVGAISEPWKLNLIPTNGNYGELTLAVAPRLARQVVQLVADHEYRYNYPLVATDNDIRLPGAHADLGGGYLPVSEERVLLSRSQSCDVPADADPKSTTAYGEIARLVAGYTDVPGLTPQVKVWESVGGWLSQGKVVHAALYRERQVHGHLARVYLGVMHALAIRAGVPLGELPAAQPWWQIPADLRAIGNKMRDYALGHTSELGLSKEESDLLQRKYIHTSANWEPFMGMGNAPTEWVFLNRPAEEGRFVEPNA